MTAPTPYRHVETVTVEQCKSCKAREAANAELQRGAIAAGAGLPWVVGWYERLLLVPIGNALARLATD